MDQSTELHFFNNADTLRAMAILAVVFIHVLASVDYGVRVHSWGHWWLPFLLDTFCRWCVPVFVMLSGALLLHPSKTENPLVFYRKRFFRVGAPFIFWTIFYLFWRIYFKHEVINEKIILAQSLTGQVYYHLYFLYVICVIYIFVPLWRFIIRRMAIQSLLFLIVVFLGLGSADNFLKIQYSSGFLLKGFSWFLPYTGYFLMGHVLREYVTQGRSLIFLYFVFVVCFVFTAAGAYCLFEDGSQGHFTRTYFSSWFSITVIPMSIFAFLILRNDGFVKSRKVELLLKAVSAASLGMFLVHPAFIDMADKFGPGRGWPGSPFSFFFWFAVIAGASYWTTVLLKKIPYLEYCAG
jgi:surface polysaccharide O-acyltransferase-like enzyme